MVRVSQYIRDDEEGGGERDSRQRSGREKGAKRSQRGEERIAKGIGSGGWRPEGGEGGGGGRRGERWVVRSRGSGANICLPPGKLKAHREKRE